MCRCAKETIAAQYTHFSIQSLRQCYSGYRSEETYHKNGKSGNCVTTGGNPRFNQFLSCTGTGGQPCAGADLTNYVYSVANCTYQVFSMIYYFLDILCFQPVEIVFVK